MPNKNYTVIISERAATMLVTHVKFLARVSPESAKKLHKEIVTEAKALELMPESYPWFHCSEIPANKYRKKIVAKRYLLIYQIRDDKVYLDDVLDCILLQHLYHHNFSYLWWCSHSSLV